MSIHSLFLCLLVAGSAFAQQPKLATEPSTGKELAQKKTAPGWDLAADEARKARMSPEELAWETLLEQNLGSFYLPLHKKDKLAGRSNAWDFVKDDPKLPRVLLIGDSVSRAYTQDVRSKLAGKANIHRAPENCGPTKNGLKKLDIWLGTGHWDVIHFNFGIHDRNTPPEEYEKNLRELVARMKATKARIIWATTTPTPPNAKDYPAGRIEKLNEVAAKIAAENGLLVDDLYTHILPSLAEDQNPGDVHFKASGYAKLSEKVAQSLEAALK